ncbi:hypothetical protein Tco_0522788 [Tanacetum coccineum]
MKIDRLSREYYYADHMNAILGVYTDLDEVTNLQCDYLETLEKCEHLEKELSKSRTMFKDPMFSELLNGTSPVVSKSSAIHAADNPDKRQQHQTTHTQQQTNCCRSTSIKQFNTTHQAPSQVSNLNKGTQHLVICCRQTFILSNQHHPSAQSWTKDHPIRNKSLEKPSQSIRTKDVSKKQCEIMYVRTHRESTKPKEHQRAMADSCMNWKSIAERTSSVLID